MADHGSIRVGTCGFGRTRPADVFLHLDAIEIQHTFYQPPDLKTLEKWRNEAPDDFEFTVKAWQLITHEASSPTYRRLKRPLTEKEAEETGFFKPTTIVHEGLATTLVCARVLRAKTVLFQCPARFTPVSENILNLKRFFSEIDRGDLNFVWEPRGKWDDRLIKELCDELDLWHVVDPFKQRPVTSDRSYFRLHGIRGWRYQYEDDELNDLTSLLAAGEPSYVFFNNLKMFDDARRFRDILNRDIS